MSNGYGLGLTNNALEGRINVESVVKNNNGDDAELNIKPSAIEMATYVLQHESFYKLIQKLKNDKLISSDTNIEELLKSSREKLLQKKEKIDRINQNNVNYKRETDEMGESFDRINNYTDIENEKTHIFLSTNNKLKKIIAKPKFRK